jgi:hypothetical protein
MLLFGHAAFQFLHAACGLGMLKLLRDSPGATRSYIKARLGIEDHPMDVLLRGTVALGLVEQSEDGYRIGSLIGELMDNGDWDAFQAAVTFEANISYPGLADLTQSLAQNTNVGLRQLPGAGPRIYDRLTQSANLDEIFFGYMHAWSDMISRYLVRAVDFEDIHQLLDVGGGDGVNAVAIARAFSHINITVLELPHVVHRVPKVAAKAHVADRVRAIEGDMFQELPVGYDGMLFAHVLHIWSPEKGTSILRRAHESLADGGKVMIVGSMSDDSGAGPLYTALDSAYCIAVPGGGGKVYSWVEFERCLRGAGFTKIDRIRPGAWTPLGVIVAEK